MRKSVIVIHDQKRKAIHFTGTKLQGEDVWFPYECKSETLFSIVEKLMVLNKVANNVTNIQHVRRCGVSEDFQVVYNAVA